MAVPSAQHAPTSSGATKTLRSHLSLGPLPLAEAIEWLVPLCLELKERHARGERFFVHPAAIVQGPRGGVLAPHLAVPPNDPRDLAAIAPEVQRAGSAGDARASVFAVAAMLYEAITGRPVGPGMRSPRELLPSLPEALEAILARGLVTEPSHRPDDLGALAAALHPLAPSRSVAPPQADLSKLDRGDDFEVDVRFSLLPSMPPAAAAPMSSPGGGVVISGLGAAVAAPPAPVSSRRLVDATTELAELKARLESDPSPRYVVSKNHMDHGPFSAVELLQQIASHTFAATDLLRDESTGETRPIEGWESFAPFAAHAARHREIVQEKKAVVQLEQAERKAGAAKFIVGGALLVALVAVGGVFVAKRVGLRKEAADLADDPSALDLDVDGGIGGKKRAAGGGRGGGGGFPAGLSYEAALASNNQEIAMGAKSGPDLSNAQLEAPMRNAAFISSCGAPDSMKVTVRVAVKNGRAAGVSVYTTPPNPGVSSCIDRHVRGLSWPSNPKMDSFTTSY